MQTTVSLGIDIGGTNIAFGIIDKSGNCLANGSLPTTAYNTPQDFVQDLYKTVKKELDNLDVQLVGIGVGAQRELLQRNHRKRGKLILERDHPDGRTSDQTIWRTRFYHE